MRCLSSEKLVFLYSKSTYLSKIECALRRFDGIVIGLYSSASELSGNSLRTFYFGGVAVPERLYLNHRQNACH